MAGEYIRAARKLTEELDRRRGINQNRDLIDAGRMVLENVEMGENGLQLTQNFSTGATRSADEHKYDFEGFLSPLVLERFGTYMHGHRKQRNGKLRDSDNWQKGIPVHKYMKSLVRHTFDLWRAYRGTPVVDKDSGQMMTMTDILMAIIFNAQGMTLELLRRNGDSIYYVCDDTRKAIVEGKEFSFLCDAPKRSAQTEGIDSRAQVYRFRPATGDIDTFSNHHGGPRLG